MPEQLNCKPEKVTRTVSCTDRVCSKCGILKPISEYCLVNRKIPKLKTEERKYSCKDCDNELGRKIYYRKKEKWGVSPITVYRNGIEAVKKLKKIGHCEKCGSEKDLTIHHINGKGRDYFNVGLDPDNNIENIQILCRDCHGGVHGRGKTSTR